MLSWFCSTYKCKYPYPLGRSQGQSDRKARVAVRFPRQGSNSSLPGSFPATPPGPRGDRVSSFRTEAQARPCGASPYPSPPEVLVSFVLSFTFPLPFPYLSPPFPLPFPRRSLTLPLPFPHDSLTFPLPFPSLSHTFPALFPYLPLPFLFLPYPPFQNKLDAF